jgi:hypothetical protein
MIKYILPILIFTPTPIFAITWREFWEPFTYQRPQYVLMCSKRIYREEYISGNRWRPGYVRHWYEWTRVPCDYMY